MPPASSHFADSPVPAPPPTIGSPRAAMPANFASRSARSNRGTSALPYLVEGRDQFGGELRIIDVVRGPDQPPPVGLAHLAFQRGEQLPVRPGIVERCPRAV